MPLDKYYLHVVMALHARNVYGLQAPPGSLNWHGERIYTYAIIWGGGGGGGGNGFRLILKHITAKERPGFATD